MDFLRDAVARGYTHPVAMRADADLDPLRARDDFRKLIVDLEAQQKVSGAGKPVSEVSPKGRSPTILRAESGPWGIMPRGPGSPPTIDWPSAVC